MCCNPTEKAYKAAEEIQDEQKNLLKQGLVIWGRPQFSKELARFRRYYVDCPNLKILAKLLREMTVSQRESALINCREIDSQIIESAKMEFEAEGQKSQLLDDIYTANLNTFF